MSRRGLYMTPGARYAVVFLFMLTFALSGLAYWLSTAAISRAQTQVTACQFRAVQAFDVAISARKSASDASTNALQQLIVTVFTPHGSPAQARVRDLAAYHQWLAASARLKHIALPPLPKTACGS